MAFYSFDGKFPVVGEGTYVHPEATLIGNVVIGKGCFVAPRNLELVHEETLRRAEEHLSQAVDIAKTGGITLAELTETLSLLYGEESYE